MPELPPLAATDFPEFFEALWATESNAGPSPFPWQEELVARLVEERRWPDLVDLPTGSGKSSLLEIAIFLQALDAEREPAERWMPRRVVLVVDRRVVVDQADDRGRRIASRLGDARDGVLGVTATRLRHLFAGNAEKDPALVTSVLRGGIVRDEPWALRPDVPALISSTVDQVGSRLLFRGYGVSPTMRPVHAGLLANDCLFLLDEVHLARPFAETLRAVGRYRRQAVHPEVVGIDRWHVVEMSATPTDPTGLEAAMRFPSQPIDPNSHPVLGRRLTASKPAELVEVELPANMAKADRTFAKRCVRATEDLLVDERTRTVGVVVNRVNTARIIAELLDVAVSSDALDADVLLLTGRMRPFDRDRAVEDHLDRLCIGRQRDADDRRLIVVATQCIEAGADFDLDGLVTECASLDALRQRFGRVDRDGLLAADGKPAEGVILARGPQVTQDLEDPVYGEALAKTWRWLNELDQVDFGISTLTIPDGKELADLSPPRRRAPRLLPSHLDAWVQTSPAPAVVPEVGQWLHGIDKPATEVQIVWREDLTERLLQHVPSVAVERVQACAPVSREALTLPLTAVRRWLSEGPPGDLADVEGIELDDDGGMASDETRLAVRWAGSKSEVVEARDLRPGDTVVIPCDYGGLERDSWSPESSKAVPDIATQAIAEQRRLAVLRLVPELWSNCELPDLERYQAAMRREQREVVASWLEEQVTKIELGESAVEGSGVEVPRLDSLLNGIVMQVHASASYERKELLIEDPKANDDQASNDDAKSTDATTAASLVITTRLRDVGKSARARVSVVAVPLDAEGDDDSASFTGASRATLDGHLDGVRQWSGWLAERVGLSDALTADLCLAASLHDLGKADTRFQWTLRQGKEVESGGELLAKSATPSYDRAGREAVRERSGYPPGARHETQSVAMCEHAPSLAEAYDQELVLHLIASHHGLCRPCAPIMHDEQPQMVSYAVDGLNLSASSDHRLAALDSGIADRFWRLVHRYGWFGLAWLETILRLADHRQSEVEEAGR